jgi:hypothetical protein
MPTRVELVESEESVAYEEDAYDGICACICGQETRETGDDRAPGPSETVVRETKKEGNARGFERLRERLWSHA